MDIRPNRVKQKLAAGQVATILAGTNDPDMIDQLGTRDLAVAWTSLRNSLTACFSDSSTRRNKDKRRMPPARARRIAARIFQAAAEIDPDGTDQLVED